MVAFFEKKVVPGFWSQSEEISPTPWETWLFTIQLIHEWRNPRERQIILSRDIRKLHLSILQHISHQSSLPPLTDQQIPYPFKINIPEVAERWVTGSLLWPLWTS
eukprot:TRINITY_DN4325_c0_g2_i4.p1 TRINITY_DN4325_c0_g2~~TRINITY_DN4325_c0_g2_i4.p1  ORF type:complete len:105 (-),score=17.04 TRINITY_DN4325_c0_g2_i4:181-495(-)